jgi:hypothetical protein
MTLKNAAFVAVCGMALLTVLVTVSLVTNLSGVLHGFVPVAALLTSLVEWLASLSVLLFFGVFYRRQ